jgi:PAS domain S-box-containing protein
VKPASFRAVSLYPWGRQWDEAAYSTGAYPFQPDWDFNMQKDKIGQQKLTSGLKTTHTLSPVKPHYGRDRMQLLELDLLYSSAPVGLFQIDREHRILKANNVMARMTGLPIGDLIGRLVEDAHPRLARQILPACVRVLSTGRAVKSYLIDLPEEKSARRTRCWLSSSYPIVSQDGTIAATSHILQDISELRQAQEHIRLSKIMLQSVFDGISDPLIMVDRGLKVRMFNRAAKDYFHVNHYSDLLGKRCSALPDNKPQCRQCKIIQAVTSATMTVFERQGCMEKSNIEKVTIYPLSQNTTGLDGSIVQITDITETKTIERQLVQNEKLASLGLLVSGVAHEINNPNNFITFNIPILKSYMRALLAQVSDEAKNSTAAAWFGMTFEEFGDEVFKLVGNLEHGTHRIAKIVSSLRTLMRAKSGGQAKQLCSIPTIVGRVDSLCRSEIQKHVKNFKVRCPDDLPMVVGDSAALEQILTNLVINAAHAADKPDSRIELTVKPLKANNLEIEVADNGSGMSDETLKKIFDPFFTTKDPGLGTGLGLSVCHSLVNAMQGELKVESVLDSGTVFKVVIPVGLANDPDPADGSYEENLEKAAT